MSFRSDEQRKAVMALLRKRKKPGEGQVVSPFRAHPGRQFDMTAEQFLEKLSGRKFVSGTGFVDKSAVFHGGVPGKGAKLGDWSMWLHAKYASGTQLNRYEKILADLISQKPRSKVVPVEWKKAVKKTIQRLRVYYHEDP